MLAPTAAFASEPEYQRATRGNNHYNHYPERVRTIDFYNLNRAFDRRNDRQDEREWNRRSEARESYWRDRRDDRFRRHDRRDRYEERRIIIIPRFSF
ncbi:hypothetical protein [Stenomitos frigidus]|uniref:hypothetical protein n=1 Tax=Stenomitos frigidus TaxID=1886765 RepID=UPI0011B29BC8|nr:hypothetical protein [Stenomitos frigidus]